ncbi:hypothetical protein, partial [Zhouia amylolytica]|uniref:hypothetical protein n=1 Tax=Zhouia amylolytica TaxID=376730 RepID=UPI001F276523
QNQSFFKVIYTRFISSSLHPKLFLKLSLTCFPNAHIPRSTHIPTTHHDATIHILYILYIYRIHTVAPGLDNFKRVVNLLLAVSNVSGGRLETNNDLRIKDELT